MDVREFLDFGDKRDLLRFTTLGNVDDGKSTLIGRLLADSRHVYDDHLSSLRKDSKKWGTRGDGIEFSLLLDGLRAEREQGITIDVAYRYFFTPRRKFIIADNPGHVQYTRNMATGASTANLAVILVDAVKGLTVQSKRHAFIASLLGIKHFVIAVNKMDLVEYSEEVFIAIRDEFTEFTRKMAVYDLHFIPISAIHGENVVKKSRKMGWYSGDPLLSTLENVHIASDVNLIDMRFPVQFVQRPTPDFRGFSGSLASGVIRRGDEVLVLPSGRRTRVKSIITFDGELDEAFIPMAITVVLDDEIDVSRGDMLVHPMNVPNISNAFEAIVIWMNDEPFRTGKQYLLKHTSHLLPGTGEEISYGIDVDTLHRVPARTLRLNEIGRVRFHLTQPVYFDDYSKNRLTGSFILIDRLTYATVGAGIINDRPHTLSPVVRTGPAAPEEGTSLARSIAEGVSSAERTQRFGHRPLIIALRGGEDSVLSCAASLERILFEGGIAVHVIQRRSFGGNVSKEECEQSLATLADILEMCRHAGLVTVVPLIEGKESDSDASIDVHFLDISGDIREVPAHPESKGSRKPDRSLEAQESSFREIAGEIIRKIRVAR
jgi:bifunctional enzyme CysN/CysC